MALDYDEIQRNQILARNLRERLTFNEKQRTWKLEGPLTSQEYRAFTQAIQVFDEWAFKQLANNSKEQMENKKL